MSKFRIVVSIVFLTFLGNVAAAQQVEQNRIFPQALKEGDVAALVTPSYKIDRVTLKNASRRIENLGLKPYIPESVLDKCGCYGGTAQARARELNAAFADPKIKGIFAVRGGAGASNILPLLDYDLIKQNPKIFVGYSDTAALLNYITIKTGLITFHGPLPKYDMPKFTNDYFKKLTISGEGVIMRNTASAPICTIKGGRARGRIFGGNLTTISTMLGTKYLDIDWRGKILFLEDVSEKIYSIDRMLSQLKNAGILDQISGFVFGTCVACRVGDNGGIGLNETLKHYFEGLDIPAFSGAMIGHQPQIFTLPIGAMVEIDGDIGTIKVLEQVVEN